jgi:hypothetical protein
VSAAGARDGIVRKEAVHVLCSVEETASLHHLSSRAAMGSRMLPAYLNDDKYSELQQWLIQKPGSRRGRFRIRGGVRKVRWTRPGVGKRGGLRIIYFVRYRSSEFWMLTLYAKAKRENVPAHILRQLVDAFKDE